jgi:hypothetical protein
MGGIDMKKMIAIVISLLASSTAVAAPAVAFDAASVLPPQLLSSGFSQVQMSSVFLNTGSGYSSITSRFTVPTTGVYQLNANVSLDTGGQDCSAFILSLFVNGYEYRRLSRSEWGHQFELAGSTLTQLSANDVVDVRVFHNCASPVVVEASGRAYFSGALL